MRNRLLLPLLAAIGLLIANPLPAATEPPGPNPVATTEPAYQALGRVWSDPHGCERSLSGPAPRGISPWAKGHGCAVDFLSYEEVVTGARFLAARFPNYLEVIRLDERYGDADLRSAGLARAATVRNGQATALDRDRRPLYMLKVTDRRSAVPEPDRLHFAYSLSIHGPERQGLEGGIRALEDLVTWAACEDPAHAANTPACATEGPFPKRIVESQTTRPVPTAGEVLRSSVIYFTLSNPDGWLAGQRSSAVDTTHGHADLHYTPGASFTRGNGHGVDMNRDFPTIGYTFKPYSPESEPEVRAYARALRDVRDRTTAGKFAAGIDLPGMGQSYAFSYTLLAGSQRDYRKNALTVETSIRTWEDQTQRLCWSPWVADANCDGLLQSGEACVQTSSSGTRPATPACFADQWGTVLDTLGYTVTGIFGDWMDSPIGLNGVGINNEMYQSGTFESALVQTHIDGNKGLIFSQLAALLYETPAEFVPTGRVGYVFNPNRVQLAGAGRPTNPGLPAQPDLDVLLPCNGPCEGATYVEDGASPTLEFTVRGPAEQVFNGGITAEPTPVGAAGAALPQSTVEIQQLVEGKWQTMGANFSGATIATVNDPAPGRWRVRLGSRAQLPVRLRIAFDPAAAEASPGQVPIDASSMDFFTELNRFVPESARLEAVDVDDVLNGDALAAYDSLVVTDDLGDPAYVTGSLGLSADDATAYFDALAAYAKGGGNLVLTDAALRALPELGTGIPASAIRRATGIAGFYHFQLAPGVVTYKDPQRYPLVAGIDVPGAAEGQPGRRQAVEPTPIGYSPNLGLDANPAMPYYGVDKAAWEAACGRPDCSAAATTYQGATIALGEMRFGDGTVRIAGSLLPDPIVEPDALNDYRFGLGSFALTYTGYQVFTNLVDHAG